MFSIGPAKAFHEKTTPYGALGLFIAEASALEFAIDGFIFEVHDLHQIAAISFFKKAPRKIRDKLDFYIKCVLNFPCMRTLPFWDYELDANAVCYRVEEIFDIRNHLAHGAINLTEYDEGKIVYTAEKYTRSLNGGFTIERYSIGSGFLDTIWQDCKSTRRYFQRLVSMLSEPNFWEKNYQVQKEIIESRKNYRELAHLLGLRASIEDDLFENDEITINLGGAKFVASKEAP